MHSTLEKSAITPEVSHFQSIATIIEINMKFGIIVFPGSNCDRDVAWVTQSLLGQPTRMVWHQEENISGLDVIVIPGGFSYGDYLRCGAIARFSPVMAATVAAMTISDAERSLVFLQSWQQLLLMPKKVS